MLEAGVGMGRFGLEPMAAALLVAALAAPPLATTAYAQSEAPGVATAKTDQAVVNRYCLSCHNDRSLRGGLSLDGAPLTNIAEHTDVWERALRKLRAGAMPPDGAPRPDSETYAGLVSYLETALDAPATMLRQRMQALRRAVLSHDVHNWAGSFLAALSEVRPTTTRLISR